MSKKNQGFTLIEATIASAMVGFVVLTAARFLPPAVNSFHGSLVRSQADRESRICLDTISRVMSKGKAGTLMITNSPTTPSMPLAQVRFTGVDSNDYTIVWSTAPMNSIHLRRQPRGGGTAIDSVLTTFASELHFAPIDLQDPAIVQVTLRISVPLDSSGLPSGFYSILSSNKTVLMSFSPGPGGY